MSTVIPFMRNAVGFKLSDFKIKMIIKIGYPILKFLSLV